MITDAELRELLALAGKAKEADFIEATEGTADLSREERKLIWRCGQLLKKAERIEKEPPCNQP